MQDGSQRWTPVARTKSRKVDGQWCAALQCVVMLSQDSFYRGLTPAELADVGCERPQKLSACKFAFSMGSSVPKTTNVDRTLLHAAYNFDHPDSIDNAAVVSCLQDLQVRLCLPPVSNIASCKIKFALAYCMTLSVHV